MRKPTTVGTGTTAASRPRGRKLLNTGRVLPRYHGAPEGLDILTLLHVSPDRPVTQTISGVIETAIASGLLRPGDRIPSVAAIAKRCGCGQTAAWKVLRLLRREKIIKAKPRSGYIVGERSALIARLAPARMSDAIYALRVLGATKDEIEHAFREALSRHAKLIGKEERYVREEAAS